MVYHDVAFTPSSVPFRRDARASERTNDARMRCADACRRPGPGRAARRRHRARKCGDSVARRETSEDETSTTNTGCLTRRRARRPARTARSVSVSVVRRRDENSSVDRETDRRRRGRGWKGNSIRFDRRRCDWDSFDSRSDFSDEAKTRWAADERETIW